MMHMAIMVGYWDLALTSEEAFRTQPILAAVDDGQWSRRDEEEDTGKFVHEDGNLEKPWDCTEGEPTHSQ